MPPPAGVQPVQPVAVEPEPEWGWGWAPIFGSKPAKPAGQAAPPESEKALHYRLLVYGGGEKTGYLAGAAFGIDTRWVGLDVNADAIASEPVTGPIHNDPGTPIILGTAHATWSVVSARWARLRILTGASLLSLPTSRYTETQPWAGKILYGADVGGSGGLGLLGPFGLDGWARFTLLPVVIGDAYGGLSLHGGPIGLTGGWRWIEVRGDGVAAPRLLFRGPQVGMAVRF